MMRKFLGILQNVAIGVSIGMIVIMFIFNILMVNYIKQELSYIYAGIDTIGYYVSQLENKIITESVEGIKRDIQLLDVIHRLKDVLVEKDDILSKSVIILKEQIERQPSEIEQIENNLKQITVMIENTTQGYQGSGVTLKYKDNFYVLSAAHLIEEETDILYLVAALKSS